MLILMLPALYICAAQAAPSWDRDPTAEETLILEYMNRLRANPSAEAELVAGRGGTVDWTMFRDEMRQLKPAPPLVFHLDLLEAARRHSLYMITNGLGHVEVPGKAGFTGRDPSDRARAAGYRSAGIAENAYAAAPDAWGSHVGFVVDAGAGPGGMQPGRGHRRNMMGRFREVGPGAVSDGNRLSVTHDFGGRDLRMAGGVVYVDANDNKFYDIGEGISSVTITSSDGAQAVTWKSGAYGMELKGPGQVALTAFLEGERFSKSFPAGPDNIKFDWIVPKELFWKKADKLLAAVDSIKDTSSRKYASALVSLSIQTEGVYLDAGRKRRIEELTADTAKALLEAKSAVLAALAEARPEDVKKAVEEKGGPYRATDAEPWFLDAELYGKLKRFVLNLERQWGGQKIPASQKEQMALGLLQEGSRLRTHEFQRELPRLVARLKAL